MSTERIQVEVREDGSRVVQRNLEQMARQAEVTAASVDLMKSALNSIQGSIKQPVSSLQQMRSALTALQSAAKSPGGMLDTNNMAFATAALDRLKEATQRFAKEAPKNVSAAIERINLGAGALTDQIQKTIAAQQALVAAQAAAKPVPYQPPVQQGFAFLQEPMKLSGAGWQLEGTFKKVSDEAKNAAGTIASLAAPTQQFAAAATKASTSAQQMSLNLGAANQTSFAFMQGMAAQRAPVNQLAQQYTTVGQVWTNAAKQAQQLQFGFMNVAGGARAAGGAAGGSVPSINQLTQSFFNLRNIVATIGGYLFLRELKEYADTWIGIENSIRLSTKTSAEAAAVQESLYNAAQKSRVPIEDLVRLYRRLAQTQANIGASQQDMIDLTEGVGMAISVQGTSITSARGALLQLGQAMGMARVRAQEFNAINENAPRILQAIANNIQGANGSIDKLRQMMLSGSISGREFFNAFMKDLPRLREEFEKVRPTIGQAFAVLDNAIGKYVYDTDKAVGASTIFARAVMSVAAHIDDLARSLAVLTTGLVLGGITLLVIKAGGLAAAFGVASTAVKGLWVAISAHPIGALVTVIGTAAMAMYQFRDSIVVVEEQGITLGDVFRGQFQMIADGAKSLWGYLRDLWTTGAQETQDPILKNLAKSQELWPGQSKMFDAAAQKKEMGLLESFLNDFVNNVKTQINITIGTFVTMANVIPLIWKGMWAAVKDITVTYINEQIQRLEDWANVVIRIYNFADQIKNPFTHVPVPELSIPHLTNENKGAAFQLGKEVAKAVAEGMGTDYAGDFLSNLARRIQDISSSRQFNAAGGLFRPPDLTLSTSGAPGAAGGEVDKFQKKLDTLRGTIDPTWAAVHKLEEAEEILNEAIKRGIPLWDTKTNIMSQAQKHYEDAIDPVGAYVRKLQEEVEAMREYGPERRAALEALRIEQDLRRKMGGRELDPGQRERIRALTAEKKYLEELSRAKESMYDKTVGASRRYVMAQEVLNDALKKGWIGLNQYRDEMAQLALDAGQGSWTDGFLLQLDILDNKLSNWAARTGQMLGDVVSGMVDGVANSIGRAIVYGEDFFDLMHKVGQEVLVGLIAALAKLGIQMVMNWALGKSLGAATLASNVAMANASSAAWAPAAAMASLATLGANAVAAQAAIASTVATSMAAASSSSLLSLERGGFTGMASRKTVTGLVHGQEFVMNADVTRKYRPMFEALNSGREFSGFSTGGYATVPMSSPPSSSPGKSIEFKVDVQNYTSAKVEVEQISPTEVRIIAREAARRVVAEEAEQVVAARVADPNSQISRSLQKNTTAGRVR